MLQEKAFKASCKSFGADICFLPVAVAFVVFPLIFGV
jgi:hypothetical protein